MPRMFISKQAKELAEGILDDCGHSSRRAPEAAYERAQIALNRERALFVARRDHAVLSIEELPVRYLELGTRAGATCQAAGIRTIGELTGRTADELLCMKNVGPTVVNQIAGRLARLGLSFRK